MGLSKDGVCGVVVCNRVGRTEVCQFWGDCAQHKRRNVSKGALVVL